MDNAAQPVVFASSPEAGLMNVLLVRARAQRGAAEARSASKDAQGLSDGLAECKIQAASGFGGLEPDVFSIPADALQVYLLE